MSLPAITNDTLVAVLTSDGDEIAELWRGPFADFCAANKFEDEELAENSLTQFHRFEGGEGALAGFALVVV